MTNTFTIKNRYTAAVMLTIEGDTLALALSAAVKAGANLSGANLYGADLRSADLSRADLRSANLSGANLSGANLSRADLRSANLYGANLSGANLSRADLRSADLRSANLYGANLSGANLSRADLRSANLSDANLHGADLRSADLSGANLYGANLRSANLSGAVNLHYQNCPQEGSMIVYKKLFGGILAKLQIPENAKRTSSIIGRKCRAEFVLVLELTKEGIPVNKGVSMHDKVTEYKVGDIIKPDKYNYDPREECTNGIHFFISKQEAIDYV